MNEPYPEADPFESTPSTMPYHDRSTGLVIFGILTLLQGCLSGLLVPLMFFGQAMSATTTQVPPDYMTLLPAVYMYTLLAVALIWLGIGSILARRWARALLLIYSWSWLIMGLLIMLMMAFIMPKVMANLPSTATADQPALPAAAMDGVLFVMFLVDGVLFVVLPAIWTFFYNSRHVKATCDARDPVARWTDACPLPVLALCLWLWFSIPMMLLMPIIGHGVAPFFGMFLTGLTGALFYLAIAALWSCASWLLYRLDPRGWWLILIAMCLFMASTLLTYARHDVLEMYHLMGYPEAQIEQIQKLGLLAGNNMVWLTAFSVLPFLVYLFFIKKYFRRVA